MTGPARLARRVVAVVVATTLLLALALAWDVRPALPPWPRSFSAPLPASTISGALDLAAWSLFVLLDLILVTKALQFAIRREPTRTELRLRRAFAERQSSSIGGARDWRALAPLAPPVLRLPSRREPEPEPSVVQLRQPLLLERPVPTEVAAATVPNKRLGVLLLGPLELAGCKKKEPRRQATSGLIAYLAVQPRRASRDELLEALWPGDDPHRSVSRFYQAASEARKLLGEAFQRDRDIYALDRQQVWVDVDELDRLRSEAETTTGGWTQTLLENAVELFRGRPLAGIDALWADAEARRLQALHGELLERIARLSLEAAHPSRALEAADRARALEPSNERLVQLALEAEAALGRREAVVERYERLCRELDEQFGLEPSRDTKLLYRRLLSQEVSESQIPARIADRSATSGR